MTDRKGILKNSPLVYALASIRFAPWPLMTKRIEEIHDELRDLTPLIQNIQFQNISIHTSFSGGQVEPVTNIWMLLSSDRSLGVHLAPDQLLVFSKKYTDYTAFEQVLDKCLNVLLGRMRFMDVISAGVRYVDLIKVKDGEDCNKYITKHMLLANFSGFDDVGCIYAGSYKSGDDNLIVRCTSQPDAPAIPEDMLSILSMSNEPGKPLIIEKLKNGILLDIDAQKTYSEPQRMDKDKVLTKLKNLHQKANTFFRHDSVCTEYAFKTWKDEV